MSLLTANRIYKRYNQNKTYVFGFIPYQFNDLTVAVAINGFSLTSTKLNLNFKFEVTGGWQDMFISSNKLTRPVLRISDLIVACPTIITAGLYSEEATLTPNYYCDIRDLENAARLINTWVPLYPITISNYNYIRSSNLNMAPKNQTMGFEFLINYFFQTQVYFNDSTKSVY